MSEYADILVTPRIVQICRKLPEKATPEETAAAIVKGATSSSAKLTKGEVSLVFELMPAEEPEDEVTSDESAAPIL